MNSMPPITKNLLIINVLVFFATHVASLYGIELESYLGLHFFLASDFHLYQFLTYMFMHAGIEHLFFNMFAVWMFGRIIERTFGSQRYLFYYLVCGIGAGMLQEVVQYVHFLSMNLGGYGMLMNVGDLLNGWTTVGASGAVYGILLAFGMCYPEERLFIFPLPIPIKAKYFVAGYALLEFLMAFGRSNDGVAHFAHLGGMLFGLILILYWRKSSRVRQSFSWDKWFKKTSSAPKFRFMGKHKEDMEYNQRQNDRNKEIDRILDKVKKHGYGSLTEEEKRKLFDASGR